MLLTLCAHKMKDMFKSWLTIGLVSFLLAGCAESTSDNEKNTDTNELEVKEEPVTTAVEISDIPNSDITEVENGTPPSQPSKVSAAPASLNPPHGQPGHDCAIPVGAPLDGSGAQNQSTISPNLSVPATQTVAPSSAPADGINPPHGQPGHDCAVPVGSPLPSK